MLRMVWKKAIYVTMALAVVAALWTAGPERAAACSCAINPDVSDARHNSDAVFEGTVTGSKKWNKLFSLGRSSADPVTWHFQVNEVWKGKVSSRLSVQSAMSSASCGFEFQEGKRYLVYAHGTGSDLEVSLCSRTVAYSEAAQDLIELGQGSVPTQSAGGATGGSGGLWGWLLAAVLAIAAGIATTVFLRRRGSGGRAKSKR